MLHNYNKCNDASLSYAQHLAPACEQKETKGEAKVQIKVSAGVSQ